MWDMSLTIAGRPTNLHLPDATQTTLVDSDLYHICDRIAEIDPRLFIVHLAHGEKDAFAIMERCEDGVDRLVFKVAELDARVVDRLREIQAIPFEKRFEELEKREMETNRKRNEEAMDELYERLGGPMYTQLAKDNFIDRGASYPIVRSKKWRQ